MNPIKSAEQILDEGLAHMGLQLDSDPFLRYLTLLQKWNKAYSLTAIRDLKAMVIRHVLDSLAILPFIHGNRLLDVGTGAGLPGIPLAIANSTFNVTLLDSNGKKISFLQEVKRVLKLDHVEVVQSRVENYHPPLDFDTVTSRAFSELTNMLSLTSHLIAKNGIWLAMKGHYPEAELTSINSPYQVQQYQVPGLEGERCCVIIENAN